MSAKFGPAGNSDSFSKVHRSSVEAPGWIAGLGLDCYEYQCGKGVHVGEETARKVGSGPARPASPCPSMPPTSSTWPIPTGRPWKKTSAISLPPV